MGLSKNFNIFALSKSAERLYQWKYEHVFNKNFLKLCEDCSYTSPIDYTFFDNPSFTEIKSDFKDTEEQLQTLNWFIYPILSADYSVEKALLVGKVIEKNKEERTNILKNEFIRNMEHDIRTPFCGVWGLANQLYQKEKDPFKKEILEDITNCAKELLDYCTSILDFSVIEAGTTLLEKKFDVKKLIESVTAIEKPPAKLSALDFSVEHDEAIPPILIGDPHRLQRILINLIGNAIKFTRQGHVKLMTKLIEKQPGNRVIVRFIVEDTGIGIPPEKQDLIYESFVRLTPSNKEIYKGVGLGLSIVKRFVEEMKGEVDLKSELDKGSTFICSFPFKLPLVSDIID